ncbi:hypothetical protein WOLCODRAFT_140707 [Wolfiporia cocos MD-104 SS10]|uniref:N-acetyltransferase domain-containing protein n=1 Tax=Wolfiporia cocos (strain MD-104) TaxID=742152 RepID=A0A2H3J5Z5_WOLCO|nr:hypothetical protein WOLCODRAFT_140707 [Wolfiporia cocos MD-104 SS10]
MSHTPEELPGLTAFPVPKPPNAIDREIVSPDGRLRLAIYRVGFQIQREIRNEFDPWLRYYRAKIELGGRQIGQLAYRLINPQYLDEFQEDLQMSEHGAQELETIGGFLFNKDGSLQERWGTGSLSGTGVFGTDLAASGEKVALLNCSDSAPRGDFLMIEDSHRRRGIGLWAILSLFSLLKEEGIKYIITCPSIPRLNPSLKGTPTEERLLRRNIAFVRKAGFRRIGLSPAFAYMLQDEEHPSRRLAADADMDPARLI